MSMNKKILVLGLLLLFSTFAFAISLNSITEFTGHWDSSSNIVVYNLACKSQSIGSMIIQPLNQTRSTICSAWNLGQTWAGLGGFSTANVPQNMVVTVTIPAPCDVCTKSIIINSPSNQSSVDDSGWANTSMWIFLGIFVIVIVVFGWVVNRLNQGRT